jgi:hypothetical protein
VRSFAALVVLVTLIHVAALVVILVIRLWPDRAVAGAGESVKIRPCAVCGEPATHLAYDGLDPGERRDPHTGRAYSIDMAHYHPLCAAHGSARGAADPAAAGIRAGRTGGALPSRSSTS